MRLRRLPPAQGAKGPIMQIAVLAENTALDERFGAEHGLSLYIQACGLNILFDMGQSDLFACTAQKLGIDLAGVDIAVLSHGHYDHGGGLETFFKLNKKAPVYVSRQAFVPHINASGKNIGLDPRLAAHPRLHFTDDGFSPAPGLTLFTFNGKPRPNFPDGFGLCMVKDGQLQPDDFFHEQYLLIEEQGRRIAVSGCSHKGVLDITDWLQPDVLIGGFHFSKLAPGEELERWARYLDAASASYYTCHCTGQQQYLFMKKFMRRLESLSCGQRITI